jgi:hypothetical protein
VDPTDELAVRSRRARPHEEKLEKGDRGHRGADDREQKIRDRPPSGADQNVLD